PAEALPLSQEALDMLERLRGTDLPHPEFPACLHVLGQCHLYLGQTELALQKYEAALAMCRQLYDGPHFDTTFTLYLMSEALRRLGRLTEAEQYATKAVLTGREHSERGPPYVNAEFSLAHILIDAGRPDDAIASARKCMDLFREHFASFKV